MDRRNFLQSTTAVAAATASAVVSPAAIAKETNPVRTARDSAVEQSTIISLPTTGGRGIFDNAVVKSLIATRRMLTGMDTLLYEHIRATINSVSAQTPRYNSLLYESLFESVGKLLDECLAYRRECMDLEAQAVRRALEYQLFQDQYKNQTALQQTLTSTAALDAQRDACSSASAAFGGAGIENGFKTLYAKGVNAIDAQKQLEANKLQILQAMLDRTLTQQQLLEERHTTPGHSLNYVERRGRLIALIVQNVAEAFQKARAAKAGIESQLGISADSAYPFPVIYNDSRDALFLDQFVLWVRSIVAAYELQAAKEVTFDRVIPLTSSWTADLSGNSKQQLMTQQQFDVAMAADGRLTVSLQNVLPSATQVKNLRVRAIGISVGVTVSDFGVTWVAVSARTWSCEVFPPAQLVPGYDGGASGVSIQPAPIILGRVAVAGAGTTPEMVSGPQVWNIDPRGDWTIVVNRLVNWPLAPGGTNQPYPDNSWPRDINVLKDLKIHVRLVGQPTNTPATWVEP